MKPQTAPPDPTLVRANSPPISRLSSTFGRGSQLTLPFRTAIDVYAVNPNASGNGLNASVFVTIQNDNTETVVARGRIAFGSTGARVAVGRGQAGSLFNVYCFLNDDTSQLVDTDTPIRMSAAAYNCACDSTGAQVPDVTLAGGVLSTQVQGVITRLVAIGLPGSFFTIDGSATSVPSTVDERPRYGSLVNPLISTSAGITSLRIERTT